MPDQFSGNDVVFHSGALDPGDLFVRRLLGRESISRLYEYELLLQTTFGGPLGRDELEDMLLQPATVAFGEAKEHPVHGVLREVEMVSMGAPDPVVYRAVLVPRLWHATRTLRSRVFQDLSIPEIAAAIFKDTGMEAPSHFDMLASASAYPKREYTVQYQETDLDFVCRLLEHEGIFFFFDESDDGDKLVVADANGAFLEIPGQEVLEYRPQAGVASQRESVLSLSHRLVAEPATLILRDYNYRTPGVDLTVDAPIDKQGRGQQVYYGDHYKDPTDGKRLAKIRAEEIFARRELFLGESSVRALHAGTKFELQGHFIGDLDQPYVVTDVFHSVEQGGLGNEEGGRGYHNQFTAIPFSVAYRPERVTPKPRISGVMHGKIDGPAGSGTGAPIDGEGRYKVLLPLDVGGDVGGKASRWIRMLQPYAGAGYGMHFPLHIGTEVAIGHLDGDPDRPVIMGSVPNPETTTPVNAGNATQSVIQTRSGVQIRFEDDA